MKKIFSLFVFVMAGVLYADARCSTGFAQPEDYTCFCGGTAFINRCRGTEGRCTVAWDYVPCLGSSTCMAGTDTNQCLAKANPPKQEPVVMAFMPASEPNLNACEGPVKFSDWLQMNLPEAS